MNDPLFWLFLILRYMHILGAIALMGGTIFMRFALRPVVVGMPPDARTAFHEQIRSRWAKFVMLATLLILVSGLTNLAMAGQNDYKPVFGMAKGYHMLVGIKFLLGLPIFFIAAALMGRSNMGKRMQANAEFWLNINLTLALIMVLMGGYLRFVWRQPKMNMHIRPQAAVVLRLEQNASKELPFLASAE
jgi:uncharacterized membrane protein